MDERKETCFGFLSPMPNSFNASARLGPPRSPNPLAGWTLVAIRKTELVRLESRGDATSMLRCSPMKVFFNLP